MIVLPYFQNIAPTGRHWERRMPLGGSERFQNPFFPAPFPPIIYAPFQSHFRAIPEPFPSHSRAIPTPMIHWLGRGGGGNPGVGFGHLHGATMGQGGSTLPPFFPSPDPAWVGGLSGGLSGGRELGSATVRRRFVLLNPTPAPDGPWAATSVPPHCCAWTNQRPAQVFPLISTAVVFIGFMDSCGFLLWSYELNYHGIGR